MLTNIKPVKVSLARRTLVGESRFTADLNGIPVVFGGEGDTLLWIEPLGTDQFVFVCDDDREGYLVGETFIDCDDYTAASKQAERVLGDLTIAARDALEVWASSVVADRVAV
jgi:hypothetical protein